MKFTTASKLVDDGGFGDFRETDVAPPPPPKVEVTFGDDTELVPAGGVLESAWVPLTLESAGANRCPRERLSRWESSLDQRRGRQGREVLDAVRGASSTKGALSGSKDLLSTSLSTECRMRSNPTLKNLCKRNSQPMHRWKRMTLHSSRSIGVPAAAITHFGRHTVPVGSDKEVSVLAARKLQGENDAEEYVAQRRHVSVALTLVQSGDCGSCCCARLAAHRV